MITIVQLEYVVAVDKFRNFARASEHCFVTQPTLSIQIKKLEHELGIQIFDRSVMPVVSTEIGARFIEQAKVILSESERIEDLVKSFRNDFSGELHIGIIPTLGPYLLPLFAGDLKRHYPEVNLRIDEMVTGQIIENLKNGNLDAGVLVTPYGDKKIVEHPVFFEEMFVYAHKDHPYLRNKAVKSTEIVTDDIWLLGDSHCFRTQVVNLCGIDKNRSHNLPFDLEGGSLDTLLRIINREGGFTIIPELFANSLMESGNDSQIRPFSDKKPLREISVCYSSQYPKRRLIDLLIQEIQNAVPQHTLDAQRGETVLWR